MKDDILHHFLLGGVIKETHIPAGRVLVQHKHAYDHISILLSGSARIAVEGEAKIAHAMAAIKIAKGKVHSVRALTDCVWLCIHATEETDIAKLDVSLIEPGEHDEEMLQAVDEACHARV